MPDAFDLKSFISELTIHLLSCLGVTQNKGTEIKHLKYHRGPQSELYTIQLELKGRTVTVLILLVFVRKFSIMQ